MSTYQKKEDRECIYVLCQWSEGIGSRDPIPFSMVGVGRGYFSFAKEK